MEASLTRRDLLAGAALAAMRPAIGRAEDGCRDLDALLGQRRMVRKFRPDAVADETIRGLIDTATRAPSAGHLQPWSFVVVREAARRRSLAAAAFGQMWLAEAPVCVVPCAVPARSTTKYRERGERYAVIDTAFASMLLLLAVTDAGLGTCFVGAFDDSRVRSLLGIPQTVTPLALMPIGHPAESPASLERRPLADVIHEGSWSTR